MRHVRPVRLVLTAAVSAATLAIALHPPQAHDVAATTPPAPVDTLVTAADPALPTIPDERVEVSRVVRQVMTVQTDQIPMAALAAYQRAAAVADKVDGDCGITWTLLAAVGGVESDHGRHGDSVLRADGTSRPLIRGVALDGRGRVAKVADTDAGRIDGDKRWDRAVGPMQFLPSTWATVGVDADSDGERSADDLDDAALGAAVFLCAVPGDLTDRAGVRAALLRYNPSSEYVAEVIALEREYRTGQYAEPEAVSGPVVVAARQANTLATQQPAPSATPGKPDRPGPESPQGGIGGAPVEPDDEGGKGDGEPPRDPDQEPRPPEEPEPQPEPEPVVEELTGLFTACGTPEAAWCVDDVVLDLGDADHLAAEALADFDADGTLETNADEIAGLADTEVTLLVERSADAAPRVLQVAGVDYVAAAEGSGPSEGPSEG